MSLLRHRGLIIKLKRYSCAAQSTARGKMRRYAPDAAFPSYYNNIIFNRFSSFVKKKKY